VINTKCVADNDKTGHLHNINNNG